MNSVIATGTWDKTHACLQKVKIESALPSLLRVRDHFLDTPLMRDDHPMRWAAPAEAQLRLMRVRALMPSRHI